MSGTKIVTEEDGERLLCATTTEWTEADLQRLLAALKNSIPEHDKMTAYQKGLKSVDWKKVAFPPFSPEACRGKITQILQKMRKIRSLTELIVEAEDVISNPEKIKQGTTHSGIKALPEPPKTPSPPNAMFYEEKCAEYQNKYPDMSKQKLFKRLTKKYQALPDEEKAQYVKKFEFATEEYTRRIEDFCKQFKKTPSPKRKTNRKRKRLSADTPDGEQECEDEDEEDMPPKPPVSGFHIFCQELGMPSTVSFQYWQALTETRRDEYNTLFKELKKQYLVKLRDYLNTFDKTKQQQILNKKSMKRFGKLKDSLTKDIMTLPGEPKMPSRTGNHYFIKNQMVLLKDEFQHSKQRLSKASHMWFSLSSKEKEHYNEEAREGLRKYSIELQKWFKTLPAAEQRAYRNHNRSKRKYLDDKNICDGDSCDAVNRPSDSEDEDIEDSSSDEEENDSDRCEVEEEEEEENDSIMFDLY